MGGPSGPSLWVIYAGPVSGPITGSVSGRCHWTLSLDADTGRCHWTLSLSLGVSGPYLETPVELWKGNVLSASVVVFLSSTLCF